MPGKLPRFKSDNYENFGGINTKTSPYSTGRTEFLALYNFDFSIPGSLTERPGSTMYVGSTFNDIVGIFEFNYRPAIGNFNYVEQSGFSGIFVAASSSLYYIQNTTVTGVSMHSWGATYGVTYPIFGTTLVGTIAGYTTSGLNTNGVYRFNAGLFQTNAIDFADFNKALYGFDGNNTIKFCKIDENTVDGQAFRISRYGLPRAVLVNVGTSITGVSYGGPFGVAAVAKSPSNLVGYSFGFQYFYAVAYENNQGFRSRPTFIGSVDARAQAIFSTTGGGGITWAGFAIAPFLSIPSQFMINKIWLYASDGYTTTPDDINDIQYFPVINFPPADDLLPQYEVGHTYAQLWSGVANPVNTVAGEFGIVRQVVAGQTQIPANIPDYSEFLFPGHVVSTARYYGEQLNADGSSLLPSIIDQSSWKPKFGEVFNNRMFLAVEDESRLEWSEIDVPEQIEPENFLNIPTGKADGIRGLKKFASELVIGKEFSVHSFTGEDPTNFARREITDEYGFINNQAVATWENYFWFLDPKGICQYDGARVRLISQRVEDVFRTMNIATAKKTAVMTFDKSRNELRCSIPVSGSATNNLTVVYDLVADAFSFWDGHAPKLYGNFIGRNTTVTPFYSDFSGRLNTYGISYFADNGVGFTSVAKGRYEANDGQSIEKMFRRLFVNAQSLSGASHVGVTIKLRADYLDTVSVTTGASITQNRAQNVVNFGVSAKSLSVEVSHFSAADRIRYYGYSLESRYQRST